MNSTIHITLGVDAHIKQRLDRLRVEFMHACNWLVPFAVAHHCWNRVALHHLAYHKLRAAFPHLGSQMSCNAIYSVCRSYRLLLAHPHSPLYQKKIEEGKLPHLQFLESSPVFFDRHTLSVQKNMLSLYTLEGRLRFAATLSERDRNLLQHQRLREVQLMSDAHGKYQIQLTFANTDEHSLPNTTDQSSHESQWPSYIVLIDDPQTMPEGAHQQLLTHAPVAISASGGGVS